MRHGPARPTRARVTMLSLLFLATTINYVDRSNLSIVAPFLSKELGLEPVQMGLLFSAFAWSYAIANLPGGYLIDRFGSRLVYGIAQLGMVARDARTRRRRAGSPRCSGSASPSASPKRPPSRSTTASSPPGSRSASAAARRRRTRRDSTSARRSSRPLLFWMAAHAGWRSVFWVTGIAGILSAIVWLTVYREPRESTRANAEELALITAGGALTEMAPREHVTRAQIARLLRERQVWALGLGKFAVMSSLYFLLTWFPTYLVQQRGLTSLKAGAATSLPYVAATIGVMLGGAWSDWLLRRGAGISAARKIPIVTGFLGASSIVLVNYVVRHRARARDIDVRVLRAGRVVELVVDHRRGRAAHDDGHDGRHHQLHRPHRGDRHADPHRLHPSRGSTRDSRLELVVALRTVISDIAGMWVGAL